MKKQLATSILVSLLPISALAHHGTNSQFDPNKPLSLSGVVTELKFVNPHSYVYFDVTNAEGEVENWHCEMRAANALKRSGWTEDMFQPGTVISLEGIASRKEPNGCYVETLALGGGEAINRYAQLDDQESGQEIKRVATTSWGVPNLAGDWAARQQLPDTTEQPSYLGGPPGMGAPAGAGGPPDGMGAPPGGAGVTLTAAGQIAMAELQATADENVGRLDCKPRDFFSDWVFDQHSNRIIQEEDKITMRYGFMDTERVIYLNMSEHPDNILPSFAGHSIGWWEGEELVVDTIGFAPKLMIQGPRIAGATSDQYHVVERFSVDNEAGELTRSYIAEDPLYWANGYQQTGEQTIYLADYPWEPYQCEDLTVE